MVGVNGSGWKRLIVGGRLGWMVVAGNGLELQLVGVGNDWLWVGVWTWWDGELVYRKRWDGI